MRRKWSTILALVFGLVAPVLADPPLQVIYSHSSDTKFGWWPDHTVTHETYTGIDPYASWDAAKPGWFLKYYVENLSQYRFFYMYMEPYNDWGYFFPVGSRLIGHVAVLNLPPVVPIAQNVLLMH